MSEMKTPRLRIYFTVLVGIAEIAHLAWEHFHGGIHAHHFLQRADMPAIHNSWGLILLPALSWFVTGRIWKRVALQSPDGAMMKKSFRTAVAGFVGALLFGILLAVSFASGNAAVTSYLFQALLVLALLLPVYRAECVLGFALGMTFTIGAVLPTFIGAIIAAVSAILHLCLYPYVLRCWIWFRRRGSSI